MNPGRIREWFGARPSAGPWLVLAGVLALTALVYAPVRSFEYVAYDDPEYVAENALVQAGFTWDGIRWAFSTAHTSYWHPLTWLSHMFDAALFGAGPAGPHAMNALLHLANTVLVFTVFRRFTGAAWRSVLVAAWFALHPLHVESVAWISERKDVLGAFFFLLALQAWAGFAAPAPGERRGGRYAAALACFALGLMSKPMVVTLPCVLLLLDAWPLGRLRGGPRIWAHRVAEKLPFFALAGAAGAVAFLSTRTSGAVESLDAFPPLARAANAAVSYARYLGGTFWPANLAFFYPHPGAWPAGTVALAGAVLAALSATVLGLVRRRPWAAAGWCWFLGMLVPTIGFVQVGVQSRADRYMYLPALGLFVPLAWAAAEFAARRPGWRAPLALGAAATVAGCAALAGAQVGCWRDTETLCRHALAVTDGNFVAHNNLANVLQQRGDLDAAAENYRRAIALRPDFAPPYSNLAQVLLRLGDTAGAIARLREAAAVQPDFAEVHSNLGNALRRAGRLDDAAACYRRAIALRPDLAVAHHNLGTIFLQRGEPAAALAPLQTAVALAPGETAAQCDLGFALAQAGRGDDAIAAFEAVLARDAAFGPARYGLAHALLGRGDARAAVAQYRALLELAADHPPVLADLAWVLATWPDATVRDRAQALDCAQRAERLAGGHPLALRALAAAYAENGRFPDAVAAARRALELAETAADAALVAALRGQLACYEAGSPFREPAPLSPPPAS